YNPSSGGTLLRGGDGGRQRDALLAALPPDPSQADAPASGRVLARPADGRAALSPFRAPADLRRHRAGTFGARPAGPRPPPPRPDHRRADGPGYGRGGG